MSGLAELDLNYLDEGKYTACLVLNAASNPYTHCTRMTPCRPREGNTNNEATRDHTATVDGDTLDAADNTLRPAPRRPRRGLLPLPGRGIRLRENSRRGVPLPCFAPAGKIARHIRARSTCAQALTHTHTLTRTPKPTHRRT